MSDNNSVNRRDLLRGAAAGAIGAGSLLEEMRAEAAQAKAPPKAPAKAPVKPAAKPAPKPPGRPAEEQLAGPTVRIAVIGLGPRGREILGMLGRVGPAAEVVSICDHYKSPVFSKRASEIAPKATWADDYRRVLDDSNVQAVFIATPSHKHKQVALDAIAAGKHVYCEAPLAHTVQDAAAIARAAKASKTVFQSGLQYRCNGQTLHVGRFIQSKALGDITEARAQWHEKSSWFFKSPTNERQDELNWRLRRATSPGLMGEVGIHQLDVATWLFKQRPVAITGFGSVQLWKEDGRDVPDTVQCVVEYPGGVRLAYDATLTNSFDGAYELFLGTDAAAILRDQRAWMFKEADAGQLGWEVFARKDEMIIGDPKAGTGMKLATGIALVADATKQLALGRQPGEVGTDVTKTALYQAVVRFLMSCQKGERIFARDASKTDPEPPLVPGPEEGYEATVVALKANEAVLSGGRVAFEKSWFTL